MTPIRRIVFGGALVLVLVFAVLFSIEETRGSGTIVISRVPEGAVIFFDNKRIGRAEKDIPKELRNLSSGTHLVLIAKDGYWPWGKEISIEETETAVVSPFILPQEISVIAYTEEDERYAELSRVLAETIIPSTERRTTSADNRVEVWLDGATIMAEWISDEAMPPAFCMNEACEKELTVLESTDPIRGLTFYPERNDLLLFSSRNGVFAIELDKRGTQNFQPLYVGVLPQFAILPDNRAVIEESDELYVLEL